MRATRWGVVATAVAALLVAACEAAQTPAEPARAPTGSPEVRRAGVPVPGDYHRQIVEFADAEHGYAQFLRCGASSGGDASCTGILVGTRDGGRSWQKLRHPNPVSSNPQLYVGDADTVLLFAEPGGWYVSTDAGRTFTRRSLVTAVTPAEYFAALEGGYGLACEDPECRIMANTPTVRVPLPVQPDLPGRLSGFAAGADQLWAASVRDGRPYTAFSADQGRTWHHRDVPAPRHGRVANTRLLISADGRDAWLLGYPEPTGGTGGMLPARALRKDIGVPEIWYHGGQGWVARSTAGLVEAADIIYSFAPVGGGELAVAGRRAFGYLAPGGYAAATGAPRLVYVRTLRDGTIFAYGDDQAQRVWLGIGAGRNRKWVEIVTETA